MLYVLFLTLSVSFYRLVIVSFLRLKFPWRGRESFLLCCVAHWLFPSLFDFLVSILFSFLTSLGVLFLDIWGVSLTSYAFDYSVGQCSLSVFVKFSFLGWSVFPTQLSLYQLPPQQLNKLRDSRLALTRRASVHLKMRQFACDCARNAPTKPTWHGRNFLSTFSHLRGRYAVLLRAYDECAVCSAARP